MFFEFLDLRYSDQKIITKLNSVDAIFLKVGLINNKYFGLSKKQLKWLKLLPQQKIILVLSHYSCAKSTENYYKKQFTKIKKWADFITIIPDNSYVYGRYNFINSNYVKKVITNIKKDLINVVLSNHFSKSSINDQIREQAGDVFVQLLVESINMQDTRTLSLYYGAFTASFNNTQSIQRHFIELRGSRIYLGN